MNAGIPTLPALDSSFAFLSEGYMFGTRRFARTESDAFSTRIMGRPVTLMHGLDAAHLFYEGGRFRRERTMPEAVLHLPQEEGSVQSLTGQAHLHRELIFARMLSDKQQLQRLRHIFAEEWFSAVSTWPQRVVLHDVLKPVITRAVLRWVGIDPQSVDVSARASGLGAMIENAGKLGAPAWKARILRQRTESWARSVIGDIRSGNMRPDDKSMIMQLASHTNDNGHRLEENIAAGELVNLLRPTLAVGRLIVFIAHALERHPRWKKVFATGHDHQLENFVNEVRRFYPFIPVIDGRVRHSFEWRGKSFGTDDWVMLDLYATHHDARLWKEPNRFHPERFTDWDGDQSTLITQGAGDVPGGQRIPGEQATIDLMKEAVILLAERTTYAVPQQDLRISLRRFPALPKSGFALENAERR